MRPIDLPTLQPTAAWPGQRPAVTVLHQIVGDYLETFIQTRKLQGRPLARFVQQEFLRFLECGDVQFGYAGVFCPNHGILATVPISCNRRSWCPRCMFRRMMERADFITDRIVGDTPVRHYVVTFPPPLRYDLLYRPKVAAEIRKATVEQILVSLRRRAKKILGLSSIREAHPGAIMSSQRCSGNLAPNYHSHLLVTDGVFVCDGPEGEVTFQELPPPSEDEIAQTAWAICCRTRDILKSHGIWRDVDADGGSSRAEPNLAQQLRGVLLLRPDSR